MSKFQTKDGSKPRSKGKKKAPRKPKTPVALGVPTHLYYSTCCEVIATKTPCVRDRDVKFEDRKATLGTWKCSKCRKKAKVSRVRNKENVDAANQPAVAV